MPMVAGSYNDWEQPAQLLEIRQFSHHLDKKKREFIKMLQKQKLISRESSTF